MRVVALASTADLEGSHESGQRDSRRPQAMQIYRPSCSCYPKIDIHCKMMAINRLQSLVCTSLQSPIPGLNAGKEGAHGGRTLRAGFSDALSISAGHLGNSGAINPSSSNRSKSLEVFSLCTLLCLLSPSEQSSRLNGQDDGRRTRRRYWPRRGA